MPFYVKGEVGSMEDVSFIALLLEGNGHSRMENGEASWGVAEKPVRRRR
jgi:hypothetical protein